MATQFYLVPRLRKCAFWPPLSYYVFVAWCLGTGTSSPFTFSVNETAVRTSHFQNLLLSKMRHHHSLLTDSTTPCAAVNVSIVFCLVVVEKENTSPIFPSIHTKQPHSSVFCFPILLSLFSFIFSFFFCCCCCSSLLMGRSFLVATSWRGPKSKQWPEYVELWSGKKRRWGCDCWMQKVTGWNCTL